MVLHYLQFLAGLHSFWQVSVDRKDCFQIGVGSKSGGLWHLIQVIDVPYFNLFTNLFFFGRGSVRIDTNTWSMWQGAVTWKVHGSNTCGAYIFLSLLLFSCLFFLEVLQSLSYYSFIYLYSVTNFLFSKSSRIHFHNSEIGVNLSVWRGLPWLHCAHECQCNLWKNCFQVNIHPVLMGLC